MSAPSLLSAFEARPVVELKARDKSKIESVLAYGDRLLVGLNSGSLRVYRLNEFTDDQPPPDASDDAAYSATPPAPPKIDLLREEEKFAKKPVQQLAVIKEANLLVSLSDGHVSLHDLQSYALTERLERTKGATHFVVISQVTRDDDTGIPSIVTRLAVAVKRKVLLWSWRDMEPSDHVHETTLPAAVKLIAWANAATLLAAMDPGYVLVNVDTGETTEINRAAESGEPGGPAGTRFGAVNASGMSYMGIGGWVPKPMATKISDHEIMLARDVNTLFIDLQGKPRDKRQVPWVAPPEAVGYSYPYLLALSQSSKGVLEVRNPDTLTLLQQIKLPDATILHVPQPNISLAHAAKGFLIASERCIWRMSAMGYASQIEDLLSKSQFDEAISFVGQLEDTLIDDKDAKLRDIQLHKAQWLFDSRKYRDALDLFAEAEAPPARVIALYPPFIAGDLSKWPVEETADEGDADTGADSGSAKDTASVKDTASLKGSIRGKPGPIKDAKDADAASIKPGSVANANTASPQQSMESRELKFAIGELRSFLAQSRVRVQPHLNFDGTLKDASTAKLARPPYYKLVASDPTEVTDWQAALKEAATLVDTALFRAYITLSPSLTASLFRIDNFCDPAVVEEKLYDTGRYQDLIEFLHGKRLHKRALELLATFGKGKEEPHDDSVDASIRGPNRTVSYLQQLPFEHIDLILHFAEWPLRNNPELGMQVFLGDTEIAENLPRDRVVDFLGGLYPSLAEQYLEHIIDELADSTPIFHDRLISLYLARITSASTDSPTAAIIREKLDAFLHASQEYTPDKVLPRLDASNPMFYEARATVLSRLHRHREALQIYVFDVQDPAKAESYCNAIFSSAPTTTSPATSGALDPDDPSQATSIYTTLLGLYLSPPEPHAPNLEAALLLLSHHGSRLPALSTLSLVPSKVPIKNLESYFRARMRAAQSLAREEAIVRALASVEKANVEAALLLGEEDLDAADPEHARRPPSASVQRGKNRRIVVGEHRLCQVCNKRFQRSALRIYPDGRVVHYGCAERASEGRRW